MINDHGGSLHWMLLHIELGTLHSQRGTVAHCTVYSHNIAKSTLHSCTVSGCAKRSLTDGAASLCQTPWPHQRPSKRGKAKKIKNLKILPPLTSHQGQNISPTKTLKGEDQRLNRNTSNTFFQPPPRKRSSPGHHPPRRSQSFICIVLKPGSRPTKEKFRCQEIRLIRRSKLVDEPDWSTVYVHLQLYQELFRFHEFPCFKSLRASSSSSSPSSAANADD